MPICCVKFCRVLFVRQDVALLLMFHVPAWVEQAAPACVTHAANLSQSFDSLNSPGTETLQILKSALTKVLRHHKEYRLLVSCRESPHAH